MTPEQANESRHSLDEQLQAAAAGGAGGGRISRSADLFGGRYAAVMGALMALYLLVVIYVYPQRVLWLDILATAAFAAGMVSASVWHERRRRAASLGWARRYSVAFALSAGLFGLGMALSDLTDSRSLWLWMPYAAVTALPLVASALIRGSR
jgi:hypothetical protein